MARITALELDRGELMAVARENDEVRDGLECTEEGALFVWERSPSIDRALVSPQCGERDGGDDEFEYGSVVDLRDGAYQSSSDDANRQRGLAFPSQLYRAASCLSPSIV